MRENVSGTIERMGGNGKSFLLEEFDGKWFGAFNASQLSGAGIGDELSFTYTSVEKNDRTFHNINGNVKITGTGDNPVPPTATGKPIKLTKVGEPILARDRCIIRQNALTNAVNFTTATKGQKKLTVSDVLQVASEFEAYSSGDIEKNAAAAAESGKDEQPTDEAWKAAASSFGDVKELKQAS